MDYDALKFWFEVLVTIALFGNWIYMWLTNRSRVNKEEIREVIDSVSNLDKRQTRVEEQMKSAPTHNDLSRIYERMNGVDANVSKMGGSIEQMSGQLGLVLEHLLDSGGK